MPFIPPVDPDDARHLSDLVAEQSRLVEFFSRGLGDSPTGFFALDLAGGPDPTRPLGLYAVARLVHCFSVENMLGRSGAREISQRAVDHLLGSFLDHSSGGFVAAIRPQSSDRKELYGHAFALLAGASAKQANLDGADELFEAAREALDSHFWVETEGAAVESWDPTFTELESYRGQNGNMHLTEAYLAAFEATGDPVFLDRAERIAERLVNREARSHDWRVPEHYFPDWQVHLSYNADNPNDPFRPAGTMPGHALEWSRLLLSLGALRPEATWTLDAAQQLFATAVADGWDETRGGLVYSVDFAGATINPARMHWTAAEAIGAALFLFRATGDSAYSDWYSLFWTYVETSVIDRENGSWWHELDADNRPSFATWDGKPDLYHSWQATLYARLGGLRGVADAARRGAITPARSTEGLLREQ